MVGRAPAAAPEAPDRGLAILAFVVMAIIGGVSITAHTMWFDELQAWNIARASHSVADVFTNLRYEGHPALWDLVLFPITRFTGDPRAMQVLEWLVLCATYAVVLFRAPFAIGLRIAMVAGYFVTFEYGVISRSYGLGMLLLLLALTWLGRPEPAWGKAGTALALLAWTSLAGGVFAFAVAATVALGWRRPRARAPMLFVGGVAASVVAAAATCIPPSDFHSFSLGIPSSPLSSVSPTRVAASFAGPWRGLFPIPVGVGRWNTNLLDGIPAAVWVQAALGLALVVLVAAALRGRAFSFRLWLIGTLGYLVFSVAVVLPDRSHYAGESFLLFVACCWLAVAAPDRPREDLRSPAPDAHRRVGLLVLAGVVFAAQIVATVGILPNRSFQAFTPDRALAAAARDHGLAHDIVSGQDFDAVTMAGYLDVPIYSIARGESIRYFVNDQREADGNWQLTGRKILCRAAAVAAERGHPVAVVADKSLPAAVGARLLLTSGGVGLTRVTAAVDSSSTCTGAEAS